MAREGVFDELLCFLGGPMFQNPVRQFMDDNCIIFDPTIEPGPEHHTVHSQYKKVVDALLEGFCKDEKLSVAEAVKGLQQLSQIPDLREVFQTLFEQVLATCDFNIFAQLMVKWNIMIQEQVLVLLIASRGSLPDSMIPIEMRKGRVQQKSNMVGAEDQHEEQLLQQVMKKSKAETDRAKAQRRRDDDDLQRTIELSKKEALALQEERKQMEQDMKKLTLTGPSLGSPQSVSRGRSSPAVAGTSSAGYSSGSKKTPTTTQGQTGPSKPAPMKATHPPSKSMSGAEAASQWEKSARAEANTSSSHNAFAASFSGMSEDELKKRQDFLRQQRDKLLAMKKEQREKQIGDAEKSGPKRPQSAKAARSAMRQSPEQSAQAAEDEKKMAMRRAIADRLRQEVIGKQ